MQARSLHDERSLIFISSALYIQAVNAFSVIFHPALSFNNTPTSTLHHTKLIRSKSQVKRVAFEFFHFGDAQFNRRHLAHDGYFLLGRTCPALRKTAMTPLVLFATVRSRVQAFLNFFSVR